MMKRPKFDSVHFQRMSQGAITRRYNVLKAGLKVALGEYATEKVLTNLMGELLDERMQAWSVLGSEGEKTHVLGLFTTCIHLDRRYDQKILCIETMTAYGQMPRDSWSKGLAVLEDFARETDCAIITADIINQKMARLAEMLGFQAVSTKVIKEIPHG